MAESIGFGQLLARAWRASPLWISVGIGGVLVFALLARVLTVVQENDAAYRAAANAAAYKAAADAERERKEREVLASCQPDVVGARVDRARGMLAAGKSMDAAAELVPCEKALVAGSAAAALLKRVQVAEEARVARLDAERAANMAKVEAADKARRRREGVRIGMSQADVLASSWGRPEKVNETRRADFVREQWVYGGGNYLYFENGTLVSMQRSR